MSTTGRSARRNVFLYSKKDKDTLIGGLVLNRGITNSNFYQMVGIVAFMNGPYHLEDEHEVELPSNDDELAPGTYFIATNCEIIVNNEVVVTRTISLSTGTRYEDFRHAVRKRDGGCVVSKIRATGAAHGDWIGFHAAHIFPVGWEQYWIQQNYARWISILPGRGGPINSVQNGLLLHGGIHQVFDAFNISINPDDNYKIVSFQTDPFTVSGTYLDSSIINDPCAPSEHLLRWHFRQAVLVNMRGAGEPFFEHDFPPGSDIMGDIRTGPKAEERMEFELHSRLASVTERETKGDIGGN